MINAVELFPVERRDRILGLLQEDGKVVALYLARRLNVLKDTVRRDVDYLASAGSIRRVHGGALPAAPVPGFIQQRSAEETEAKKALAQQGASLVRAGSVVLFDSGSSNLEIVKALPRDIEFTAVTPCLPIAVALTDLPEVTIVVLGGRWQRRESMSAGLPPSNKLEDFLAHLSF